MVLSASGICIICCCLYACRTNSPRAVKWESRAHLVPAGFMKAIMPFRGDGVGCEGKIQFIQSFDPLGAQYAKLMLFPHFMHPLAQLRIVIHLHAARMSRFAKTPRVCSGDRDEMRDERFKVCSGQGHGNTRQSARCCAFAHVVERASKVLQIHRDAAGHQKNARSGGAQHVLWFCTLTHIQANLRNLRSPSNIYGATERQGPGRSTSSYRASARSNLRGLLGAGQSFVENTSQKTPCSNHCCKHSSLDAGILLRKVHTSAPELSES